MAAVGRIGWRVLASVSGVVAGLVTQRAVNATWRFVRGTTPPDSPENPDVTWTEAVAWVVASGVGVAVARLLATRQAAAYWRRTTGSLPPGLAHDESEHED